MVRSILAKIFRSSRCCALQAYVAHLSDLRYRQRPRNPDIPVYHRECEPIVALFVMSVMTEFAEHEWPRAHTRVCQHLRHDIVHPFVVCMGKQLFRGDAFGPRESQTTPDLPRWSAKLYTRPELACLYVPCSMWQFFRHSQCLYNRPLSTNRALFVGWEARVMGERPD